MEDKIRVNIRESVKKSYQIRNRYLSLSGDLDWPLYLAILRVVRPRKKTFQELTETALLKRYAPAAVLVDQSGNILYVHGHTGLYLEPAQGYTGNNNIRKMVKKRFRRDLNITFRKAVAKQEVVDSPEIPVIQNSSMLRVEFSVLPLSSETVTGQMKELYLVIFNQKNELVKQQTKITTDTESISESAISHEMDNVRQMIISKETELAQIKAELENVNTELEISRNKLHLVKENIYTSETELQTLTEKITLSKDELESIKKEINKSKDELEDMVSIPEEMTEELTPFSQELEIIKNELSMANQELNTKKKELEKLNQPFEKAINETPGLDQKVIQPPDLELNNPEQTKVSENDKSFQSFETDPSKVNLGATEVNDKGMGFIARNEAKPFFPLRKGLAFGHESESFNAGDTKKELKFKDVQEFQASANIGFRHDSEIESVVIPEGVEVVKRSMFYKCNHLKEVSFPSTLKIIEDFAFYGCEKLNKVALEKCRFLETIGTSAFEGCLAITELVIPDSIIEIEEASFLGCKAIESVKFQDNSQLEILGSHVFKDCIMLSEIFLPDQLKHIGISCFYGCKNLSSIYLSRDLQTVGEYAFWGCDSLSEIKVVNKNLLKQPGFTVGFPETIKL